MKKIFYAPRIDNYSMPYDHPLLEEEVYIPPVPYLTYFKESHEKHVYWKCPAWKTSFKNSYVFFSQIDVEVKYNKETGIVDNEAFKYCTFDEAKGAVYENAGFFDPREHKPPPPYNGVAVGQVNQQLIFWSEKQKNKNLWLEIQPVPDMIRTHNAELIGGEFPFSRWFRPSLFAFKFHNETTVIKRGEPLGIIKFKNLDDYLEEIVLERAEPSNQLIRKSENHTRLKIFLPNKSWNLIKDKPESKCPFKKFWR